MSKGKGGYLIFHLPIKIIKRRNWYLASCSTLDLHSQGKTKAEARDHIMEAINLFFESCFERKTLEAVLGEAGIALGPPEPSFPKSRKDFVDVPVSLLTLAKKQAEECHV
jgi:predicted RNase H-like HicB family nuclease